MPIDIIDASLQDKDRIFQFLLGHFYPDEPLNTSIGRVPTCQEESPFLQGLEDGLSFIAVEKENPSVICGLALNKELRRESWEAYRTFETNRIQNETEKKNIIFMRFLLYNGEYMFKELFKRWDATNTDKAFDVTILCVSQNHRRKNIGSMLMEKCIETARARNYPLMTIECSSTFSALLAEKHGFKVEHELAYEDYKDEGRIVIKPKPPHTKFRLLIKDLTET